MINVGILGAGRIGKVHALSLKKIVGVNVKSVADPYLDEEWAISQGIENRYKDVDAILNDDSIDAVYICTPTDSHADLIIKASQKGKAIFCEKPVDLDISRILKVQEILKENNTLFQIGFNRRFDKNFKKISELVKNDTLGNLISLKVVSRDPSAPPRSYVESSGGLFLDMTIHDFDMVRFLSHQNITEITAKGASLITDYGDIDIDTAMLTMTLEDGSFAMIENCRATTYGYDQRVEVFGTKSNVNCKNVFDNSVEITNNEGTSSDKPMYFFLERYEDAYYQESVEFVNSINNSEKVSVGIEDALESALMAVAAKKSLEENRSVTINEIREEFNIKVK
ncbi:MAG: inositol 2-dehydrogenase [Campylobacteraceae bacterium]|nr:inositol 2-dehydrogenase [Campylobacteraceae bacterium]